MRLNRCGAALPALSLALVGAAALASPSLAADDGYPPGMFERSPEVGAQTPGAGATPDEERDFSGSPPAYRLPAPGSDSAQGGPPAPEPPAAGEGPAEQDPYASAPPWSGGPRDGPSDEGPYAAAPPPYGPPSYGEGPVGEGFYPAPPYGPRPYVAAIPAPPYYGYVRPGAYWPGPRVIVVVPPPRGYVYGPRPFVRSYPATYWRPRPIVLGRPPGFVGGIPY
jgi:protein transport protein SEC24